jgi:riboflavin transporter
MDKKLVKLIKISLLSAMAFVLMLFEFPVPLFPVFLKLDLSDIPALLGAFSIGPLAGVAIELIKNILFLLTKSTTAGIGELANFIVGGALVFTAGLIYRNGKTRKRAFVGLALGTVVMAVVASFANYFVFLPLYETVLNFPMDAIVAMGSQANKAVMDVNSLIVYSFLPFNLLKGFIVSLITLLIYKKVSPVLHK